MELSRESEATSKLPRSPPDQLSNPSPTTGGGTGATICYIKTDGLGQLIILPAEPDARLIGKLERGIPSHREKSIGRVSLQVRIHIENLMQTGPANVTGLRVEEFAPQQCKCPLS